MPHTWQVTNIDFSRAWAWSTKHWIPRNEILTSHICVIDMYDK